MSHPPTRSGRGAILSCLVREVCKRRKTKEGGLQKSLLFCNYLVWIHYFWHKRDNRTKSSTDLTNMFIETSSLLLLPPQTIRCNVINEAVQLSNGHWSTSWSSSSTSFRQIALPAYVTNNATHKEKDWTVWLNRKWFRLVCPLVPFNQIQGMAQSSLGHNFKSEKENICESSNWSPINQH